MSQYFTIQLSYTNAGSFALSYNPDGDSGTSLLLWAQQPPSTISAAQDTSAGTFGNQQWSISWDGYISSAVEPTLFLTAQEGLVTLASIDPGQTQQWVILPGDGAAVIATKNSYDAYLQNKNSGSPPQIQILATVNGQTNSNVWLTPTGVDYPISGPSNGWQWTILPCYTVVDQWTTIKSRQSPDGTDILVSLPMKESRRLVTENGTTNLVVDTAPQGTGAVAATRVGSGGGSTWQLTTAGCLTCSWNSALVLTAGADSSGNLDGTVWVFPQLSSPPPPNQVWIVPERGVLVSQATQSGQVCALTVPANDGIPTLNAPLTMTAYTSGSPTPEQRWDFFPGVAVQTLLVQPPVNFPELDSATYQAIEAQLWPTQTLTIPGGGTVEIGPPEGGLRGQYTNLAAPLAGYQSQILAMTPPSPPPSAWSSVVAQLVMELRSAQAVQALFQQMTLMSLELTQAQSIVLSDIAAQVSAVPSTPLKTKFKWQQLVMGIVYTALNVGAGIVTGGASSWAKTGAATAMSAVANLLQTAFNSVQLKGEQTPPPPATTLSTYAELEQTLLDSFEQMEIEIANIERMVLTDWAQAPGLLPDVHAAIRRRFPVLAVQGDTVARPQAAAGLHPGGAAGPVADAEKHHDRFLDLRGLHILFDACRP